MCRYKALVSTLQHLVSNEQDGTEHNIGELTDQLQESAFSITSILISLPFLQPFPLGLFALIGSAAYWSLGWQLLQQRQQLALPVKVRNFTLKKQTIQKLINTCLWIIRLIHQLAKPRLRFLCQAPAINMIGGFIYLITGILIAIPLGGVIPFRNLLPALAILFYTVAEVEQDGALLMVSMFCVFATIIVYSVIIYLIWQFGAITLSHLLT